MLVTMFLLAMHMQPSFCVSLILLLSLVNQPQKPSYLVDLKWGDTKFLIWGIYLFYSWRRGLTMAACLQKTVVSK